MRIYEAAKVCCDRLGLLAAFHRLVNRDTLTVVMFHRVLPPGAMAGADPDYTVSDSLFSQCLAFFRRHYTIVGLDEVLAAQSGGTRLPRRGLLITFDDGWDDNLAFAVPQLAGQAVPALVFVSTDGVADDARWWWQEVLLAAIRQNRAGIEALWNAVPGDPSPPPDGERILRLLVRYGACAPEVRRKVLEPFAAAGSGRHMLTPARLRSLAEAGIAIGSHGAGHLPLTMIADPGADIEHARRALADWLAGEAGAALSFPHGRHSPAVIAAAFSAGYRLLFTSDTILNTLIRGRPARILGRIEIPAHEIADRHERLQSHRLAAWLFLRPRRNADLGPHA